jgi:hypothetical protein
MHSISILIIVCLRAAHEAGGNVSVVARLSVRHTRTLLGQPARQHSTGWNQRLSTPAVLEVHAHTFLLAGLHYTREDSGKQGEDSSSVIQQCLAAVQVEHGAVAKLNIRHTRTLLAQPASRKAKSRVKGNRPAQQQPWQQKKKTADVESSPCRLHQHVQQNPAELKLYTQP